MPVLSESSNLSHPSRLKSRTVFAMPAGFSGCAFWRFRLPIKKLKKLGTDFDIRIADNPNKILRMEEITEIGRHSDLIHMQSPGHGDAHLLMRLYKQEGKKILVDYDDYSFDLHPGNPRYMDLGTKECEVLDKDGKVVFRWKDGESGFDLKANIAKYDAFRQCVAAADGVTTTTEYLANKFREINPNVYILPNSVDFDLWKAVRRPAELKDQVRIGWFGGDSHYADLKVFKGLFRRLLEKYPQVKIVLQCPPVPEWEEFFGGLDANRFEWSGWADLSLYTLFLASKQWDIGLCPLEDNEFNRCKSNIKVLEFASMGVPVVAQNMIPYSNHIRDGETGYLASTEDEWFEKVSILIDDIGKRIDMGNEAWVDTHNRFNLEKNCRLWERAYAEVLGGVPCSSVSTRV